ncbi:MAG: hypothetical protein E7182_02100 [Erysipelotrichaceae bacterium]|nr:hypothetical protein [Erysipelotrichaceae bacterium]
MKAFCNWMDERSRLVKILFCLPFIDIIWGVYRLGGAIANKNVLHIVLAVLWILFAAFIGWVADLVCIILFNHICWFQE